MFKSIILKLFFIFCLFGCASRKEGVDGDSQQNISMNLDERNMDETGVDEDEAGDRAGNEAGESVIVESGVQAGDEGGEQAGEEAGNNDSPPINPITEAPIKYNEIVEWRFRMGVDSNPLTW